MTPGKHLHGQPQRQTFREEGMTRIMVKLLITVVVLWPTHWGHAMNLTHEQVYVVTAPGVVFVYGSSGKEGMVGSGSIVRSDGLVLTNAHVILDKATGSPHDHIWVALKPDRVTGNFDEDLQNRFPAEVRAFNRDLDLALLKVTKPLPAVTVLQLGDSDHVKIGAEVVAIGHPEQGGLWTLTTGVISAFRANYGDVRGKHMFQTEASMNRGNSGGPLINGEGRQIGVNSAIARRAKDGLTITDVNFSLQSNVALEWMAKEGVTFEKAQTGRQASGNAAGTVTTDEPPKAATALPPERPYQFHQIDRWMARTAQDLDAMAREMRKHIREKRDRDVGGSMEQTRTAPLNPPGTGRAPFADASTRTETRRPARGRIRNRLENHRNMNWTAACTRRRRSISRSPLRQEISSSTLDRKWASPIAPESPGRKSFKAPLPGTWNCATDTMPAWSPKRSMKLGSKRSKPCTKKHNNYKRSCWKPHDDNRDRGLMNWIGR